MHNLRSCLCSGKEDRRRSRVRFCTNLLNLNCADARVIVVVAGSARHAGVCRSVKEHPLLTHVAVRIREGSASVEVLSKHEKKVAHGHTRNDSDELSSLSRHLFHSWYLGGVQPKPQRVNLDI